MRTGLKVILAVAAFVLSLLVGDSAGSLSVAEQCMDVLGPAYGECQRVNATVFAQCASFSLGAIARVAPLKAPGPNAKVLVELGGHDCASSAATAADAAAAPQDTPSLLLRQCAAAPEQPPTEQPLAQLHGGPVFSTRPREQALQSATGPAVLENAVAPERHSKATGNTVASPASVSRARSKQLSRAMLIAQDLVELKGGHMESAAIQAMVAGANENQVSVS